MDEVAQKMAQAMYVLMEARIMLSSKGEAQTKLDIATWKELRKSWSIVKSARNAYREGVK